MKLFNNLNFNRLKEGLSRTRNKLFQSITETFTDKAIIDERTIDDLEDILISSDLGYKVVNKVFESVKAKLKDEKERSTSTIIRLLKDELTSILLIKENIKPTYDASSYSDGMDLPKPFVILIVGVNGVGKTTTIGKLAHNFKLEGAKVLVGAADTFRAAASEQLDIWTVKAGVDIMQKEKGADPSAVAYETVKKSVDENYDVVLIDTAGRLHSKVNLMNELGKIKRAISKVLPHAPHETLLILDATVGQNAQFQATEFSKSTDITGLVITKLDGTAKGGAVFQICYEQKKPIKFIGVGEKIDDLQRFDPRLFVDALFQND